MVTASIKPDWPAPARVLALSTRRDGGCSNAPYDSFNLAAHVGDDPVAVRANRARLAGLLPPDCSVQWLSQVHGTRVVEAGQAGGEPEADACWTRSPGRACAVLTADCLPVLLCSADGQAVAAAHAGWRGLLGGVLERTIGAMGAAPGELLAWLGPAIGPGAFEVGGEVRELFLAAAPAADAVATDACFVPNAVRPGHYFADLYALARLRLAAAGVHRVWGGQHCTHSASKQYFSYRRDGVTGRMASLILLRPA
ncbi:MAG: peptidoglycan editing factor PgeF [Pseudomonadales bacterium]|nr:peptidoglycan editing factor PgeF [Pseudomonadales bacterium]